MCDVLLAARDIIRFVKLRIFKRIPLRCVDKNPASSFSHMITNFDFINSSPPLHPFKKEDMDPSAGMAQMGISQPGAPPPVPQAPAMSSAPEGSLESWIAETMAQPLSFSVSDPETTGSYYKKVRFTVQFSSCITVL